MVSKAVAPAAKVGVTEKIKMLTASSKTLNHFPLKGDVFCVWLNVLKSFIKFNVLDLLSSLC